jgi:beta-glucosidase
MVPFATPDVSALTAQAEAGKPPHVETPTDPALARAPYLNPDMPLEQRVQDLQGRLTPLEKAKLLHGTGGFAGYCGIPRVGLPKVVMTDGPQGVRTSVPTTAMPCGLAMAATWNPELIAQSGAVMGREALATGHCILLGPGVNLTRTPLGGRTFEYFGEDPLLSGKTAAGYIRGVQSTGVAACIKHWALNDQETGRLTISAEADDRVIRELHIRQFAIAIRESHPWALMPAYNRLRDEFCAQNSFLNNTLLKGELGFDGALISDWGAWHNDTAALKGACTIRMPFTDNPSYDAHLVSLVESGEVPQAVIDEAVRRNLRLLFRIHAFDPARPATRRNTEAHARIARQVAIDSAVLLKNQGMLPLDAAKIHRLLVVGPNANRRFTMVRGDNNIEQNLYGGSGAVFPPYEISMLDGLREQLGSRVETCVWSLADDTVAAEDLTAAARRADAVIFVGGLSHDQDHEGHCSDLHPDKPDLSLPGPQGEAIRLLARANPNLAVVLLCGSPVTVEDWHESAHAILLGWYPGMEGGRALAGVLLGTYAPGGRLPVTFGKKLEDWAVHRLGQDAYPGTSGHTNQIGLGGTVRYLEGMRLGYRGFAIDHTEPRYAFGHGLGYTTLGFQKFHISKTDDQGWTLAVTVRNTGRRAGIAVPQIYATPPAATAAAPEAERPVRGLVAFAKAEIAPGQSKEITLRVNRADLARWSPAAHDWKTDPGEWTFDLGESCILTAAQATVNILSDRTSP